MKLCIAVKSGLTALINPTRAGMLLSNLMLLDAVAALGETTGLRSVKLMRDMMLRDSTGRRILRERPIITEIKEHGPETLGGAAVAFLRENGIDIANRDKVQYITDSELAYVMFRYR
jgi:ubiquinone biosynthesis protein COQ4